MIARIKTHLAVLMLALSLVVGVAALGVQNAAAYSIYTTPADSCWATGTEHRCVHYYCQFISGLIYVKYNLVHFDVWWNWKYTDIVILGPSVGSCAGPTYQYLVY